MLASEHGGDPVKDWSVSAPVEGPPQLLKSPVADRQVYFSLSHSSEWLACATSHVQIGLDIETLRRQGSVDDLAQIACTKTEQRRLVKLSAAASKEHFRKIWTLKEAYLKRTGEGLDFAVLQRLETCSPSTSSPFNGLVWSGVGLTISLVGAKKARVRWSVAPVTLALLDEPERWSVTLLPPAK